MKERIKKFVNEHKEDIAICVGVISLEVLSVVVYVAVCEHYGFRMVRPSHQDEKFFYVTRTNGQKLRFPKDLYEQ